MLVSLICDIINLVIAIKHLNNTPIFTLYTYLEGLILIFFYYNVFEKQILKKISLILLIPLTFALLIGTLYTKNIFIVNTINNVTEIIILIALSLLFFYNLLKDLIILNLYSYYLFWINSGILIISSLSLFFFLFEQKIEGNLSLAYLWLIFYFVNIIFRLLLLIGICKYIKQKT